MFRSIKAAGFNFVRLPLSFSHQLVDPKGFEIKEEWFDKIAGSVDAAIAEGLYVMINVHHEGHWLHHVNDAHKDAIYDDLKPTGNKSPYGSAIMTIICFLPE